VTETEQRIRQLKEYQSHSYEYMKVMIQDIVKNAVIADNYGEGYTYPLEQLKRIARMDSPVSNYLMELRRELDAAGVAWKVSNDVQGTNERATG
jgi:hypothetical protein